MTCDSILAATEVTVVCKADEGSKIRTTSKQLNKSRVVVLVESMCPIVKTNICIVRSKGEAGITCLLRDYRDMDFNSEFDVVLVMRAGFGHYDDEANLAELSNISQALKPGGYCFLDLPNRDFFIRNFLPYIVVEKEDSLMIDINAFDALSSRPYTKRIVVRSGEVKKKPSFLRLYSSTEMTSLLDSVGMDVTRMVGAKDGTPYGLASREMGVVAQKRP